MNTATAQATAGGAPPAAPAPVVTRLGVDSAATRLTRLATPGHALSPDEWAVPRDCPVIPSLKYLGWRAPSSGGPAFLPVSEVQGVCISACTFRLTDNDSLLVLRNANLIEHLLSPAACSGILHELHDARVFEATYESEADFFAAVQDSTLVNRNTLLFSPTWLESAEPFDTPAMAGRAAVAARRGAQAAPAVPATPSNSGPADLKFLHTYCSVRVQRCRRRPRALSHPHRLTTRAPRPASGVCATNFLARCVGSLSTTTVRLRAAPQRPASASSGSGVLRVTRDRWSGFADTTGRDSKPL
ncbi:hypothetical protein AB1Y20_002380 [Prymnesium parvum]|uniref:Uncharacterized protein n=1 Tax=Prymnesium parvum TaxID=97485 RepID=A0AB34J915_PRYPA